MTGSNDLTRRAPKRHASNPKSPRKRFGFSNYRVGPNDRDTITLRPAATLKGLMALEEGNYGFVSLTHTWRGGLRDAAGAPVLAKFPGYLLGGAHLKRSDRFPGNRDWRDHIRAQGGLWVKRSGRFFVPILDGNVEAVHGWLIPFLRQAMAERRDQIAEEVSRLRARAIADAEVSDAHRKPARSRGRKDLRPGLVSAATTD